MDKVIVSYEEDRDKAAALLILLPYPLGFVKTKSNMTATSHHLESNGLIPIFITFESTLSGNDFEELGKLRFWPRDRIPVSQQTQCIGGQSTDEFCSAEEETDTVSSAESVN